jgi:hypothetical protein
MTCGITLGAVHAASARVTAAGLVTTLRLGAQAANSCSLVASLASGITAVEDPRYRVHPAARTWQASQSRAWAVKPTPRKWVA